MPCQPSKPLTSSGTHENQATHMDHRQSVKDQANRRQRDSTIRRRPRKSSGDLTPEAKCMQPSRGPCSKAWHRPILTSPGSHTSQAEKCCTGVSLDSQKLQYRHCKVRLAAKLDHWGQRVLQDISRHRGAEKQSTPFKSRSRESHVNMPPNSLPNRKARTRTWRI